MLSASTTFRGYRIAAIVTYLISDVALFGAVVAYFVSGIELALAFGAVAVIFTLIALRCGQVVFARRTYEDRIPSGEVFEFEFGARQAAVLSLFRSPVLVIGSDRSIFVFHVGLIPREPIAAGARTEGASIRQSPTVESGDVDLQVGDHVIPLRGMSQAAIAQANALLD